MINKKLDKTTNKSWTKPMRQVKPSSHIRFLVRAEILTNKEQNKESLERSVIPCCTPGAPDALTSMHLDLKASANILFMVTFF